MTRIRMLNGALYTLGIVGALTFGAVQAFASAGPRQDSARYCDDESCRTFCFGPAGCDGWGQCVCY